MRTAFIQTLTELARKDKNVWLVTGDLGFAVFEPFMKEFPDQYINVGVAEQNMIGVAAGLALAGKRPFVYSITTFATMRPYEHIRNDICYQNLPVVLIGGGSTFSYSTFGCTHFPMEDLAIMRALPNMRVTCPGDPVEVKVLLEEMYKNPGPAFMRIAKKGESVVHTDPSKISLGTLAEAKPGKDAMIIVTGRLLPAAVEASKILEKEGINARVVSAHTVKPFDEKNFITLVKDSKVLVTVEEHSLIGGLAGVVSETLVRNTISLPVKSLGVPDEFPKGVGSQDWFLERYHLTAQGIADAVKALRS